LIVVHYGIEACASLASPAMASILAVDWPSCHDS
jgi:hypothetical protein